MAACKDGWVGCHLHRLENMSPAATKGISRKEKAVNAIITSLKDSKNQTSIDYLQRIRCFYHAKIVILHGTKCIEFSIMCRMTDFIIKINIRDGFLLHVQWSFHRLWSH